jgi:hypothetical protein
MVTPVIVVLDEARDLGFEIIRQVMVLEQNAVPEGLVPALDLALGLRMARGAANMRDATVLSPFGQIARDVLDPLSLSSRGLCTTLARSRPEATNASSSVSVTSSGRIVEHSFQAMM